MLTDEMMALAAAGGSALIGAAATDAWQMTKASFSRLLGRDDARRMAAVGQQLEESRAQLTAEDSSEQTRVLQRAMWTARLEDLLIERPQLAEQLRRSVQQVNQATGMATAAPVVQRVVGLDQAQQAVQGYGSQSNYFGYRRRGADGAI